MVTTAYPNLDEHLRAWGLTVVEVSGWRTRCARSTTFTPTSVVCHHTAGPSTGNAPTLNYIVDNNLSQFVLGRDGTVYLVSGNRMNHAGYGGPLRGVPKDEGNRYSWGIEAENNGRGQEWPAAQLKAYYRLAAALVNLMGTNETCVFAHKEWAPTRKTDPRGIEMEGFRARVKAELAAGKGGSAITPNGDPVLRMGDQGHSVLNIQNALIRHGYALVADGDFGPATNHVVKDFQAKRGLLVDGIVGEATWAALRDYPSQPPGEEPLPDPIIEPIVVVVPTVEGQSEKEARMLVQFRGDPHVYEVVGSVLVHVTADAWKARGLKSTDVTILEPTHVLNTLEKRDVY